MSRLSKSKDEMFAEALLYRKGTERRAYLDESCAGDETLRLDMESLLAAHEASGMFMCSEEQTRPRASWTRPKPR